MKPGRMFHTLHIHWTVSGNYKSMKKSIYLFSVLIILIDWNNCEGKSNDSIPQELFSANDFDIHQLAVTRIHNTNSPYKDSIIVSEAVMDTIWKGLVAIFKAFDIPERDSVFDVYCIHNRNSGFWATKCKQYIDIKVDTNYSWTENWRNMNMQTGIKDLDTILSKFGFEIEGYVAEINTGLFRTNQYLNIPPLLDSLKQFEGIIEAVISETYGDGDKISYSKNDFQQFKFVFAWGDCKLGCYCNFTWAFNVDDYSNVSLAYRSQKTSLSWPYSEAMERNCNITTGLNKYTIGNESISIIYNAGDSKLIINAELDDIYYLSVFDLLGIRLFSGSFHYNTEIQMDNYQSGLYLVSVYDSKYKLFKTFKIIKK